MRWLTKKSVVSLVALVLLLIVLLLIVGKRPTKNVLDEIYYSFQDAGSLRVKPSPLRMKHVSRPSTEWEEEGFFSFRYNDDSVLKDNESLGIMVDLEKKTITITGRIPMQDEESLAIRYVYDPCKNQLTIKELFLFTGTYDKEGDSTDTDSGEQVRQAMERNSITRADVEYYCNYYLYDRVFLDWVEGNVRNSSYSPGKYGHFELVDNLWKNVDEE